MASDPDKKFSVAIRYLYVEAPFLKTPCYRRHPQASEGVSQSVRPKAMSPAIKNGCEQDFANIDAPLSS